MFPCFLRVAVSRGRPRKQSVEHTLDLALDVFRLKGYEATSIQDISDAVGLGPSSLYNTFGSKDALYLRCMERYKEQGDVLGQCLKHHDAMHALAAFLTTAATFFTSQSRHRGCAILSTSPLNTPECEHIDAFFAQSRQATFDSVRARIEQGIEDGQLRADTPAPSLARFILSICQGMSAQACDGATESQLLEVAAQAKIVLKTWAAWPAMG